MPCRQRQPWPAGHCPKVIHTLIPAGCAQAGSRRCAKNTQSTARARTGRGLAIHPELIHRLVPRNRGQVAEKSPCPALCKIRPYRYRPCEFWPAAICTQLVHSLAHLDCGQSCGYPLAQTDHPARLLTTTASKTGQKTTRCLQSPAHKACSKGSRGYPQPHTAQRCITFGTLHKNRTILCKPRGTKAAALCPRLVHSPIHAKRGQLWTTAQRPPTTTAPALCTSVRPMPGGACAQPRASALGRGSPRLLSKGRLPFIHFSHRFM